MDLEKFDPTEAELRAVVEKTSTITATDLEDPKQLAVVRENRINLKNARVQIEKTGKALREDALRFQKAVIAKEKELVAIIEPEEDRLQAIESEAKQIAEMKKRQKDLPERRARLNEAAQHDRITITDDEVLRMDDGAFAVYLSQRQMAIMEKERVELEARERAVREAEEKAQREIELREAEERARQAERDRMELEAKREVERQAAAEAAAKARAETEEKVLQAEKAYQSFLADNGYSEADKSNWQIVRNGCEVKLYKLVATYNQ